MKHTTTDEIERNTIPFSDIKVGDILNFTMAHWSVSTKHKVEIKYVSDTYIIALQEKSNKEKCCNIDDFMPDYAPIFMRIEE